MLGPLFPLPAQPKTPRSYDRTVSLDVTLASLPALCARFGITRVADLTYLDRTGIPVWNAVVPDSPDTISTYNGKGPTRAHAVAGAVMEAVERQAGAAPVVETVMRAPRDVRDGIDGTQLGLYPHLFERPIPFARGWDLIRDEPAVVPLAAVQCPWPGERTFRWATTNGIAAGNTRVEAIYHALTELVERHRWSTAHARGHLRPLAIVESFTGPTGYTRDLVDDPAGARIELPTGHAAVDALVRAIGAAGLETRLLAVADGPLPPLVIATVDEPGAPFPMVHLGLGCSWSPEHAALRALTEAVQSRVADIQAAREDIQPAAGPDFGSGDACRRAAARPHGRWYYDAPSPAIELTDLPDRSHDDLSDDVTALIAALRASGVDRAVVVDLAPPDCGVAVVRAVVPALESYCVDGRIGPVIRAILGRYAESSTPVTTESNHRRAAC